MPKVLPSKALAPDQIYVTIEFPAKQDLTEWDIHLHIYKPPLVTLRKETTRESSLVLAEKETDFIRFSPSKVRHQIKSTVAREQVEREERSETKFRKSLRTSTWAQVLDPMSLKIGCESVSHFNDPIIYTKVALYS